MPYTNTPPPTQTQATPPPNYFKTDQNLLNSSDPSKVAAGVVGAGQGQAISGSDLTMSQLLAEIGMTGPSANEQAQYGAQQMSLSEAGLGISAGQNAIQGQGLQAQLGNLYSQQGFTTAEFNANASQYPEQQAQATLANKNAQQALSDQGAISGTLNTQGHQQAVSTQQQQYGWAQEDIGRAQKVAGLQQQSGLAGTAYSAGDIARSQQNLELTAANNGLSLQQLTSQWAQGLQQLGISGDPTQLYTQYLAQTNSAASDVTSAGAQDQLLVPPGKLASGAMAGGFNPNGLFGGKAQ